MSEDNKTPMLQAAISQAAQPGHNHQLQERSGLVGGMPLGRTGKPTFPSRMDGCEAAMVQGTMQASFRGHHAGRPVDAKQKHTSDRDYGVEMSKPYALQPGQK